LSFCEKKSDYEGRSEGLQVASETRRINTCEGATPT
jgi:hypothetical protein